MGSPGLDSVITMDNDVEGSEIGAVGSTSTAAVDLNGRSSIFLASLNLADSASNVANCSTGTDASRTVMFGRRMIGLPDSCTSS